MSLESNKTLGGIGAILVAIGSLGAFTGVAGLLTIIGMILVLIAMKGLSDFYVEGSIFNNALYGFIFGIIGTIVLIAMAVIAFFGFMGAGMARGAWGAPEISFPWMFVGAAIFIWVIFVLFVILEAIFYKKSFNMLAQRSGEKMFDTAGLLFLIGGILTIILIGLLLMLIAWILAAVAFFSIKTPATQPPQAPAPPSP